MYRQASSSRLPEPTRTTEFDILKTKHKFLREDDDTGAAASWEDRLAQKYYANLYREFAVCDLKHYKSGNFALRWRTEAEVLSGAGEDTCGNTRCPLHDPDNNPPSSSTTSGLKTVELPFAYEEHGERKSALVKVVLCSSCLKKLKWKREREKKEKERKWTEERKDEEDKKMIRDFDHDGVEVKGEPLEEDNFARIERSRRKEGHEEVSKKRKTSHSRSGSPSHRRKREQRHRHLEHDRPPS